ncbi:MAG: BlaI/MecI/CopY family transcriptional regulator [Planctomycetota bacterium]
MEPSHHLGDLQHAIMRVLWERGEATVAQVHEALRGERERALTTIATMLTKLEKKGVVAHRTDGRQFVYRARVSEREVTRSMVSELTQRLFGGDVGALVGHLLTEQEIDPRELERLRALIAAREREGREG